MAYLSETPVWEEGVYQFETTDPVKGGRNGIDNVPTRQLANRTRWLKNRQDTIMGALDLIEENAFNYVVSNVDPNGSYPENTVWFQYSAGASGATYSGKTLQFDYVVSDAAPDVSNIDSENVVWFQYLDEA